MKVYVAIYEHKHGRDVRVFKNKTSAEQWREMIAEQWWEDEMRNVPMPSDPKRAANDYFERMSDREFFSVEEGRVE